MLSDGPMGCVRRTPATVVSAPRWPANMSRALKRTFKRDTAAVKLLLRFGYANDSNW